MEGLFTSIGSMDTQICGVSFFFFDSITIAEVANAILKPLQANPMPSNSMWQFIGNETKISTNIYQGLGYSQVYFLFHFKRQSNWHMLNLFGPSFIFCFLELASFLIPGELADRAAYNVTILLAFTVLQSQIIDSMPASPKPVIIQYYVFFELIYAMAVTIYSCSTSRSNYFYKKLRRNQNLAIDRSSCLCFCLFPISIVKCCWFSIDFCKHLN